MVLPQENSPRKKSLRGALQSYAKPELIALESAAWENRSLVEAMEIIADNAEKHGLTPEILKQLLENE